ncbi:hypothetical protein FDECE_679 [Fusarium decemcellulare]|nr:hypothetical protein FDECE_679 [Fusarium decemcellulare]
MKIKHFRFSPLDAMPIRVAFIGLSSSGTGWAANAHLPYLLLPRGRQRYSIVAVCNSSLEAAKRTIERHQLSPETRAYYDPRALAQDEHIDLVVCCTRVDKHYETILPSIKAGKDIYLEWPLAHDFKHSQLLVEAARESGSKTIVGLQGRLAPALVRIQHLVANNRIGKVLSAEVRASGAADSPDALPARLKYFTDVSPIVFDQIQHILGTSTQIQSRLQTQRPEVRIFDPSSNMTIETVKSNVPDLIVIQSQLQGDKAVDGATLLARFRLGSPFPDEPSMVWTITGERGEIRLSAQGSTTLQAQGYDKPVFIQVRDFATNEVEKVSWEWFDWQSELPVLARSVGRLYEAIAAGDTEDIVTFEDALERHMQLEEILSSQAGNKKQYNGEAGEMKSKN